VADYVAWFAGGNYLENEYWWKEVIYKLEKNKILQLYQQDRNLNKYNNSGNTNHHSGIYQNSITHPLNKQERTFSNNKGWAMNMKVLKELQYTLIDKCAAGKCDNLLF